MTGLLHYSSDDEADNKPRHWGSIPGLRGNLHCEHESAAEQRNRQYFAQTPTYYLPQYYLPNIFHHVDSTVLFLGCSITCLSGTLSWTAPRPTKCKVLVPGDTCMICHIWPLTAYTVQVCFFQGSFDQQVHCECPQSACMNLFWYKSKTVEIHSQCNEL